MNHVCWIERHETERKWRWFCSCGKQGEWTTVEEAADCGAIVHEAFATSDPRASIAS